MRLLESNAPRRRARAGTAASIALHAALIAVAVVATTHAAESPGDRPIVEHPIVWAAPPVQPPGAGRTATGKGATAGRPVIATPAPTAPTFSPPSVPTVDELPPVGTIVDPSRGVGDTFTSGLHAGDGAATHDVPDGAPRSANAVDRAAVPITSARPRYPETLRATGIEGRTLVRFVVDTLGRVEPGSATVVSTTHPAFAASALAVIPGLRFRPAEAGGRHVRQLAELPFEFVLR
jgi:TonB family protein